MVEGSSPNHFTDQPRIVVQVRCLVPLMSESASSLLHLRPLSMCVILVLAVPATVPAQSLQGSTASTLGGIALGAYSGSILGLFGSLLPCNRTLYGPKCAATGASVGGAVGVAMGGLIGAQNQDETIVRLKGAGVGALIGSGVGIILRQTVRQYAWGDAASVAVVGGAFGATPVGSGVGLGVGAAAGGIVWVAFPRAGLQDFIMFSLAGAAIGGMVDWADGADDAKREGSGSRFPLSFALPVGW